MGVTAYCAVLVSIIILHLKNDISRHWQFNTKKWADKLLKYQQFICSFNVKDKNILSAEGYDTKITIMRIFDKAENPESLMDIPIKELVTNYS